MSPDSRVRNLFFEWLKLVLLIIYNHDEQRMNQDIELVTTSHVPPYGYGATHGYTKIIRLVRLPLSIHFMDSTLWNTSSFSLHDLLQVTRQVIRWHCRLSHVAAHTALFTIEITDIQMPWSELILFIFSSSTEHKTRDLEAMFESGSIRDSIIQQNQKFFHALNHQKDKHILSQSYMDAMEHGLADELAKTRNLQVWPCLSFWDVGDKLSPQSHFLAAQLIPQCSAPFTTCFVEKDRCEEKGDPVCS